MGEGEDTPVPMMVDPLRDFERAKDDKIEIIADRYVVNKRSARVAWAECFARMTNY